MSNNENIVDIANNYMYPTTLESYLEKGLLKEYLMCLDSSSLEYAMDYILEQERTEIRELILKAIQEEFKIRDNNKGKVRLPIYMGRFIKTEKNTLLIFLANHKLSDYLQSLSDTELDDAERNLYMDDIVGNALEILSAIRIEKEYRTQEIEEQNIKVVK